jgi:hypothetical protein
MNYYFLCVPSILTIEDYESGLKEWHPSGISAIPQKAVLPLQKLTAAGNASADKPVSTAGE